MQKSDYIHRIENFSGRQIIIIEDLNLGGMSVTNNIENVVREIEIMEKIKASEFMIIYKDSEGVYDGFDYAKEQFIPLQEDHWKGAVSKYIKKQLSIIQ